MRLIDNAYETEIVQIVSETFQTMLATEVLTYPPSTNEDNHVTALVSFAGAWRGALALECGSNQAIVFAQRFLQDEGLTELNEDVCDSLGELANIVAGNLKGVLAPDLSLGTPSVIEGKEYHVRFCGSRVVSRCNFLSEAGAFSISLIEERQLS